jgi:hypothetical protein
VASLVIIAKFLLLIGLIRLLMETDQPLLCAGIYMVVNIFFAILSGSTLGSIVFFIVIGGIGAVLYFMVLDRLLGKGWIFWLAAIVGALIGFV